MSLIEAARAGDEKRLRDLLREGADPNQAFSGDTPLSVACREKRIECVKLLLAAGADANAVAEGKRWAPLEATARVSRVKPGSDEGDGSLEVMRLLLKAGANPDANHGGALRAVMGWWLPGTPGKDMAAAIRALAEAGGSLERLGVRRSPLSLAARSGREEIVWLLLELGADPDAEEEGRTARDEALEAGMPGCAHVLDAWGAKRQREEIGAAAEKAESAKKARRL